MSQLRTTKGQTAFEFTMMVAMSLIISAVFLASVNNLLSDAAEQERLAAVNDVAFIIQDEIILATLVEDGYSRIITIPEEAGRFTYDITNIVEGSATKYFTMDSKSIKITYPVPEFTGTVMKGKNRIRKIDGEIVVTQ